MVNELEFIRVWSIPCYDFINDSGEKIKVSVIIAPIKIVRQADTVEISYACSRALACKNTTCRYSKVAQRP